MKQFRTQRISCGVFEPLTCMVGACGYPIALADFAISRSANF
jgi:hypothetical protein